VWDAPGAIKYPGLWFFSEAQFSGAPGELKTASRTDPESAAHRDWAQFSGALPFFSIYCDAADEHRKSQHIFSYFYLLNQFHTT